MKKIIDKVNKSKILFPLFLLAIFAIFGIISTGFGLYDGLAMHLTNFITNIIENTTNGVQALHELLWLIIFLPILFLSKNTYVFTEKGKKLGKSLLYGWPIIVVGTISLISSIIKVDFRLFSIPEFIGILILTFLIGLFEELLCRGWIFNELNERFGKDYKGVMYSVFISSLIFGCIHFFNLFGGQGIVETIAQVISATIVGAAFALIYYRTKNIWSVVLIHFYWDFALMFADVNKGTACFTANYDQLPSFLSIIILFTSIIGAFYSIYVILIHGDKVALNENLPKEGQVKITAKDKEEYKKKRVFLTVIVIILIALFGGFNIKETLKNKEDKCPTYYKKEVENYYENTGYFKEYEINLNNFITDYPCVENDGDLSLCINGPKKTLKFEITDDYKFIISYDNQKFDFDKEKIGKFTVFENDSKYHVLLLGLDVNQNIVTYYSDYINVTDQITDINYIKDFIKSFKQVKVPADIFSIGYYEEANDNNKYPLLISNTENRYIIDKDGKIYTYSNS